MSDSLRALRQKSRARELMLSRTSFFELRRSKAGDASGGARRDRTDDLLLAKQALSQLSYGPAPVSSEPHRPSAFAEASADNFHGSKAGVPTAAAFAAKVGGPGKT
jgi:hypothetical protein